MSILLMPRGGAVAVAPVAIVALFASQWPTLGATEGAVGHGGRWTTVADSGLEVVDATGLDMPTPTCLAVTCIEAAEGFAMVRVAGLAPLADGATRHHRWYTRIASGTSVATTDTETHPHQDGNAASDSSWLFHVLHTTGGAGKWTPQLRTSAATNAFNDTRWTGPALDKAVTYRFEVAITRAGETFTMAVRIASAAGAPLYDNTHFTRDSGGGDTLDLAPSFAFDNNATPYCEGFNAGLNGLTGSDWFPSLLYMHQAAIAIADDQGWIGGTLFEEA
jgi:hypothetical protein